MCIDCFPTFMNLKIIKLLTRNFQLYIKAQDESQRGGIRVTVGIIRRTSDSKFPRKITNF
jgi:hypothetical protein